MASPIRLVAGLGNPGRGYERTRHNAGFWFADALAAKLGGHFAHESRFGADVARAGNLRICKPTSFMNLSGRPVALLARFFGIAAEEILVAHDELDLAAGDARLKLGGGHAGHNGLRDIHAQLGTGDYWRLRLGIGHPRDSDQPARDVADYVLKSPEGADRDAIDAAVGRALAVWPDIERGDLTRAMTALHTQSREASPSQKRGGT